MPSSSDFAVGGKAVSVPVETTYDENKSAKTFLGYFTVGLIVALAGGILCMRSDSISRGKDLMELGGHAAIIAGFGICVYGAYRCVISPSQTSIEHMKATVMAVDGDAGIN
jgi:hypothetical protein